jgi:outer membrane receptor protein involved in Fe transport
MRANAIFMTSGNLHISLIDSISKNVASMTVGSFGYERIFGMGSTKIGDGTLFLAGEVGVYNGPWVNPDDMRKISRYDGGNIYRFSLSARIAETDDAGSWKANAYVVKSELDLFNDFTYFLTNPLQGDQFHQHDDRVVTGANASRTINGSFAGRLMETTFGIQTRYDAINLGLTDTYQRAFLSNVRSDIVGEASVAVYAQSKVHWSDWLRTTMGVRGDYYDAKVNSIFDVNNSGTASAAIASPKFTMVVGPFNKTELFLGAGTGMHSNDARGATITEDPTDPTTKLSASPLLVPTQGAENITQPLG